MSIGDTFPHSNLVNGQTAWGPQLVLILSELITRCSSPVPMSALEGADFDMDNNSILNLKSTEFYEQTVAPTTDPGGMYYLNGEWYVVTGDGAIQFTSGGEVNVATTGGIGGDYGAGPEEARFVNGSQRYDFWDDFGAGNYGYVRARGFDVNNGAAGANYCRLTYGTAANITLVLPPSLPGANRSVVTVDNAGQLDHNDAGTTITNDVYLGNVEIKHTQERKVIVPSQYTSLGTGTFVQSPYGLECTGAGTYYQKIYGIQSGWRIKSVILNVSKTTVGAAQLDVYYSEYGLAASVTLVATGTTNAVGNVQFTATLGAPLTMSDTLSLNIRGTIPAVGDMVGAVVIVYDIP